jgi:hypothetical protein
MPTPMFKNRASIVRTILPPLSFGTVPTIGTSAKIYDRVIYTTTPLVSSDDVITCENGTSALNGLTRLNTSVVATWNWLSGSSTSEYDFSAFYSIAPTLDGGYIAIYRYTSNRPEITRFDSLGNIVYQRSLFTDFGISGDPSGFGYDPVNEILWAQIQRTSPNTRFMRFDATTGAFIDRQNLGAFELKYSVTTLPDKVVVTNSADLLIAYEDTTFTEVWRCDYKNALHVTVTGDLTGSSCVIPSPDYSKLYVTRGTNGNTTGSPIINCIDAATGAELWSKNLTSAEFKGNYPGETTLGIADNSMTVDKHGDVYVLCRISSRVGEVMKLNPVDGSKIFSSKNDFGISVLPSELTAVAGISVSHTTGVIYLSDGKGWVYTMTQT